MKKATQVLNEFGGVATRDQLVGSGIRPALLGRGVSSGDIIRVRRAHYALPSADEAAVRAVRVGGRLSCVSAAQTYGLWAGANKTLHVRVPANACRLRLPSNSDDVDIHWSDGRLSPWCWRDGIEDTLRSAVRCVDSETAIAVLDTALSANLVIVGQLAQIFSAEPRRSKRIARLARFGSESGVESLARQRLERRGFRVEQQVSVPGVGRVDMCINGRLLVEIDGFQFHSSREAFERDRGRDRAAVRAGLASVRFAARQVIDEWSEVEKAIAEILNSGTSAPVWRPRPDFRSERSPSPGFS
ncbi:DUF559 domain-containing protein [Leifsonia poae]|uniref:DUF559 domain-containing protein n=1 Tax=Leifsonia poae TaxID=110933 RepID=UPI001CBE9B7A|nr:DUF559 domain-containing protein [Leifsonia poae]